MVHTMIIVRKDLDVWLGLMDILFKVNTHPSSKDTIWVKKKPKPKDFTHSFPLMLSEDLETWFKVYAHPFYKVLLWRKVRWWVRIGQMRSDAQDRCCPTEQWINGQTKYYKLPEGQIRVLLKVVTRNVDVAVL